MEIKIRKMDFWMKEYLRSMIIRAFREGNIMLIYPLIIQLGVDPTGHKQTIFNIPYVQKNYMVIHEDEIEKLYKKGLKYIDELANKIVTENSLDDFFMVEEEKVEKEPEPQPGSKNTRRRQSSKSKESQSS